MNTTPNTNPNHNAPTASWCVSMSAIEANPAITVMNLANLLTLLPPFRRWAGLVLVIFSGHGAKHQHPTVRANGIAYFDR